MLHRLSTLTARLQTDREAVLRAMVWPVLVWEAAPVRQASDGLTQSGIRPPSPSPASLEPLVLEVRPPLFGGGSEVRVGRSPECDVVLAEPTVSRLHACLQREPRTGGWIITDQGSHNGTYQDGVLIVPRRPSPLLHRSVLRLGSAEVLFLQGNAFERYVQMRAATPPARLTRKG